MRPPKLHLRKGRGHGPLTAEERAARHAAIRAAIAERVAGRKTAGVAHGPTVASAERLARVTARFARDRSR